jgi:hypothetical protein
VLLMGAPGAEGHDMQTIGMACRSNSNAACCIQGILSSKRAGTGYSRYHHLTLKNWNRGMEARPGSKVLEFLPLNVSALFAWRFANIRVIRAALQLQQTSTLALLSRRL